MSASQQSDPRSPYDRAAPYIVLVRPICGHCDAMMRLVRIELHPLYLQSEICYYDCRCGASQSNTADHMRSVAGGPIPTRLGT